MFVYISPHRLDLAYIYYIMLCFHLPPRQHLHVVLLENSWTFFSYIRKYMRSLWWYATVIYTIAAKMSTLAYTTIRSGCRWLREFYVWLFIHVNFWYSRKLVHIWYYVYLIYNIPTNFSHSDVHYNLSLLILLLTKFRPQESLVRSHFKKCDL